MTTDAHTTSLPLRAGRWTPDLLHSSVGFTIRHLGISKVRGRFAEFAAELVVGESVETSSVTATVALASIDTGNAQRDEHVRAPDLLDVARRPSMAFRSTRIRGAGEEWVMEGELTIGEVTRPVTFEVEFGGVGEFGEERHAGFEATGEIKRGDFGLGFGAADAVIGNAIKIHLDVQFTEPSA
ncbi:YceI family protein [Streptomyces sp. 6N223]|uniref:YceI family protein n=1 Tax=Streptomyces sp. 6N223 TaxID=3457412 RepID=UPI003FD3F16C